MITLGIIGVVAAMTMPTLIANYQKKQAVVQLKKAYTVLSQAISRSEIDNGPISDWSIHQPWEESTGTEYGKVGLEYILPYLDGARLEYIYSAASVGKLYKNSPAKHLNGVVDGGAPLSNYYTVTKDGMIISFGHINWISILPIIQVDVNGIKKPNTFGKDIFTFQISNRKFLTGYNFSDFSREEILNNYCSKTAIGRNSECSTVIIQDGWEIKEDYPW